MAMGLQVQHSTEHAARQRRGGQDPWHQNYKLIGTQTRPLTPQPSRPSVRYRVKLMQGAMRVALMWRGWPGMPAGNKFLG